MDEYRGIFHIKTLNVKKKKKKINNINYLLNHINYLLPKFPLRGLNFQGKLKNGVPFSRHGNHAMSMQDQN